MDISALAAELAELDERSLRRLRRTVESAQRPRAIVDGREVLAFCSNDYLGLAADPRVIAAAHEGLDRYGAGAGASHLVSGHMSPHVALESALAAFVRLPRALLFPSGYMANLGIVTALVGRDDAVFADRLNHASLNDAALLSRAQFRRYPHSDVAALERLLATTKVRRKLVVTDAVFSMDGDIAPLAQLAASCEAHDAWLLVDDAHGLGVLGPGGRGTLAHLGISSRRILYMGTLGKAAGVYGAFVAGDDVLIETVLQKARPYIYTTATPPALAHALLASLRIIESEDWRRARLVELAAVLRERLQDTRLKLAPSDTAIQPLIVGENHRALDLASRLLDQGILVPAIRPPTVPAGTARLRISLSAAHEVADVEQLADALVALA